MTKPKVPTASTPAISPTSVARRRRNALSSPSARGTEKAGTVDLVRARRLGDGTVGGTRIAAAEDRRAGDVEGGPGLGDATYRPGVDAAVHFDRRLSDDLAQPPDLVRRPGDEGLSAPAGVDRHAEDDVGVV